MYLRSPALSRASSGQCELSRHLLRATSVIQAQNRGEMKELMTGLKGKSNDFDDIIGD